jgi:hypothetical protein
MELNAATGGPVRWNPYDPKFFANPFPTFRRLREEAPVYYNQQYGFYAVSTSNGGANTPRCSARPS